MIVADTLSRSPQGQDAESSTKELDDVEAHVDGVRISWPATDKRLEEIASESQKDCYSGAPRYTKEGWPRYFAYVETVLKDLYAVRGELSEHQDQPIRGSRIVILRSMSENILGTIHYRLLGITKCREREC